MTSTLPADVFKHFQQSIMLEYNLHCLHVITSAKWCDVCCITEKRNEFQLWAKNISCWMINLSCEWITVRSLYYKCLQCIYRDRIWQTIVMHSRAILRCITMQLGIILWRIGFTMHRFREWEWPSRNGRDWEHWKPFPHTWLRNDYKEQPWQTLVTMELTYHWWLWMWTAVFDVDLFTM